MTIMTWLAQASTQASGMDGTLIAGFALFGAALVLLSLELVVPSAGLLSLLCTLSIAAGVACFFAHSLLWGVASLAMALGGAPFAIGYGLRLWSGTAMARRAVLHAEVGADARSAVVAIGTEAIARTALRPVGRVEIDGALHEALAEGGFVEAGRRVRVTGVEGASLRVRERTGD
jgi:membrane-bound serine protease (ClpP class)